MIGVLPWPAAIRRCWPWFSTAASLHPDSHPQGQRSGTTLPALDGVRGLAILLVLWHHVTVLGRVVGFPAEPGWLVAPGDLGFSGVFLFFVLSGFLLFLPYARALLADQPWPSVRQFYTRRALRILPAYWVALALLCAPLPGSLLRAQAGSLALAALLLHDWQRQTFAFIQHRDLSLWTLAIEWQFYLILPWLALGLKRLAGPRQGRWHHWRLGAGLGGVIVLGLVIRAVVVGLHYRWGIATPTDLPGPVGVLFSLLYGVKGKYLEVFALGMGASLLYVRVRERGTASGGIWSWLSWGALGLCLGGLAGCFLWARAAHRIGSQATDWIFPQGASWTFLGGWVLGGCFVLLLWAVLTGPRGLLVLFALPPLRFVGKISYSLYMWHWPLLLVLFSWCSTWSEVLLLGSSLVLLVGTVSYVLLERPFLRHRRATSSTVQAQGIPLKANGERMAPTLEAGEDEGRDGALAAARAPK